MSNLNKGQILDLIQDNKSKIHDFGVEEIGIFGSYARGQEKESSDIDILAKFTKNKKTYKNFYEFSKFIEELLGKKIDILTPESLSPYLAPYIEKEIEYVKIT